MFSIMTMASSTTKPVAMVSAMSVRLFRLYPSRYMTPNVPTSDRGTATLGMIVADRVRTKRNMTMTTSAMVSISSNCTSCTEVRMVTVRSVRMATSTATGSDALSLGSSSLMLSTTLIMLAPGCRCTLTMTAGTVFIQAACLTFSALSMTSATSDSRTGAPFRYAMTRAR